MEVKDTSVRINFEIWCLVRTKTVEMSIKTGKKITMKDYISEAILEKLEKGS